MVAYFITASPEKTFVGPQIFYGLVRTGIFERMKVLACSGPEL